MAHLAQLIDDFTQTGARADELRASFIRHVDRVTRRYPDAYFELGRRTPESIESLADRVLATCACIHKGRFPFMGRTPFDTYREDQLDDAPIRYHCFDARLSITRELLRDDYAFNLRRDPTLRWRDAIHREVGQALVARAVPVREGGGGTGTWTVDVPGPRRVRSVEEVTRMLVREKDGAEVEDLVARALHLLGVPISHSRLSNLIVDTLGGPSATVDVDLLAPSDPVERLSVREAILAAQAELGPCERTLLDALCRDDSYDAIMELLPQLGSRSAVCRAVDRLGRVFVARVLEAIGEDSDDVTPAATPRLTMELILEILTPLREARA